jgi:hypothetical protein
MRAQREPACRVPAQDDDPDVRRLLLILPVVLLTVPAGAAAPTAAASKPPRIVVVEAPPATTTASAARIRFRSTARRTSCRRDGKRFRRCRRAVRYRNLRPGRHVVTVRARRRGRTTIARVRWTIVPPPAGAPDGGGTLPSPPALAPPTPVPAFEDDFTGTVLNPVAWSPYIGSGHAGNGLRRASQVKVENGCLVITAQMINGILHSGGVVHRSAYTYGRYELRIRADRDASAATSAVALTWPADGIWPEHGENDIYETGVDPDRTPFYSFVHYDAANLQRYFSHHVDGSQWHVMAMEWHAGAIRIYRDGELVWTLTDRYAIPDVAHKLAFQLDALKPSMGAPVRMYVDYVRIYR